MIYGAWLFVAIAVPTGWPGRVYLVLACVAALVLVSDWWQSVAHDGDASAATALRPAPSATPTSEDVRRKRIAGCLVTGGDTMVRDLFTQTAAFATALQQAAQNGKGIDPKVFIPLCDAWVTQGRKIQAGLPVPDPSAEALFRTTAL